MANVLIVDDNSDTVELSADLLESAGHRVTKGRNGEEGLKSLLAGPLPGCVVLDVDMPEELFRPFEQRGVDRSGIGLGLSICHKAAKANGGTLRVRDLPGKGCVFTLDLPRKPPPPLAVVAGKKGAAGSAGPGSGTGTLQPG